MESSEDGKGHGGGRKGRYWGSGTKERDEKRRSKNEKEGNLEDIGRDPADQIHCQTCQNVMSSNFRSTGAFRSPKVLVWAVLVPSKWRAPQKQRVVRNSLDHIDDLPKPELAIRYSSDTRRDFYFVTRRTKTTPDKTPRMDLCNQLPERHCFQLFDKETRRYWISRWAEMAAGKPKEFGGDDAIGY